VVQNVSFCLARGATILQDNRPDDRQCFSVNKIHQDASCSNHTPHPMWMPACMWTHSAGLTVAACWLDGELDCCSNTDTCRRGACLLLQDGGPSPRKLAVGKAGAVDGVIVLWCG
jgi:hypothetical protein